jgi:hypothetical protein
MKGYAVTHPWEKPPVQLTPAPEPDNLEVPAFLKRNPDGSFVSPSNNPPTKAPLAPLPWEPSFLSRS